MFTIGWTQHIIYNEGPDVSFRNIQLNSSGLPFDCFIAGELWNKRATLYCIPLEAKNGWNDPENVAFSLVEIIKFINNLFYIFVTDSNENN